MTEVLWNTGGEFGSPRAEGELMGYVINSIRNDPCHELHSHLPSPQPSCSPYYLTTYDESNVSAI